MGIFSHIFAGGAAGGFKAARENAEERMAETRQRGLLAEQLAGQEKLSEAASGREYENQRRLIDQRIQAEKAAREEETFAITEDGIVLSKGQYNALEDKTTATPLTKLEQDRLAKGLELKETEVAQGGRRLDIAEMAATKSSETLWAVNPKTKKGLTHSEYAKLSAEEQKNFVPYEMWARTNDLLASLAKSAGKGGAGREVKPADTKLAAEWAQLINENFISKNKEVPPSWMMPFNEVRAAAGLDPVTNKTIKEKSFWYGTTEVPSLGPVATPKQQAISDAMIDQAKALTGQKPGEAIPSHQRTIPEEAVPPTAAPEAKTPEPAKQGLLGSPLTQYMPESTMKNSERMQSVLTQINDELSKQGIQEADLLAVIQKYKEDPQYYPKTEEEKKAVDIMARLAGPPYNFDLPISGDPVLRVVGQIGRRTGLGGLLGEIPGQIGQAASEIGQSFQRRPNSQ